MEISLSACIADVLNNFSSTDELRNKARVQAVEDHRRPGNQKKGYGYFLNGEYNFVVQKIGKESASRPLFKKYKLNLNNNECLAQYAMIINSQTIFAGLLIVLNKAYSLLFPKYKIKFIGGHVKRETDSISNNEAMFTITYFPFLQQTGGPKWGPCPDPIKYKGFKIMFSFGVMLLQGEKSFIKDMECSFSCNNKEINCFNTFTEINAAIVKEIKKELEKELKNKSIREAYNNNVQRLLTAKYVRNIFAINTKFLPAECWKDKLKLRLHNLEKQIRNNGSNLTKKKIDILNSKQKSLENEASKVYADKGLYRELMTVLGHIKRFSNCTEDALIRYEKAIESYLVQDMHKLKHDSDKIGYVKLLVYSAMTYEKGAKEKSVLSLLSKKKLGKNKDEFYLKAYEWYKFYKIPYASLGKIFVEKNVH